MNYAVKVTSLAPEDGGGFQAIVPAFGRGLVGYGPTQTEAVADLLSLLPDFVDMLKSSGQEVPDPQHARPIEDFSGKFNVRIPKILHAQLVDMAEDNEVSLNQLVTMFLTNAVTMASMGCLMGYSEADETRLRTPETRWEMPVADSADVIDATSLFGRERNRDTWLQESEG